MTTSRFNARHGISIGTTPVDLVDASGNITAGTISGSSITVTGAISGTSLTGITSSTLVTNLNADKLDGNDGTYFTTAGNLTGTIPSAVLGNSSFYIGSTAIALNQGTGTVTLPNAALANSSVTIGSTAVSLGGTAATIAGLTLTTPVLGVATATSINKVTITAPATSATLTIANGKTFTVNNSVTISGTDATTITLPSTTGTLPLNNQTFYIGTTPIAINAGSGTVTSLSVNITGALTGNASTATSATSATNASNVVMTDDNSTGATYYPVFAVATGTAAQKTSSTKLTYYPSSGNLTAPFFTSSVTTGTAPFVVTSTTQVANLNASMLVGNTWAIPAAIGATTPNTGAFTSITATLDSSFNSTGAIKIPASTTANRPTASVGKIRVNTDLVALEGCIDGATWMTIDSTLVTNNLNYFLGNI